MNRRVAATTLAVGCLALFAALPGGRSASACDTPPITRAALNTAIDGPVVAFPENEIRQRDDPVDAAMVTRLLGVLAERDACARTGEPLRVWSLYSSANLARLFQVQGHFDEATYAAYAVASPRDDHGATVQSFQRIWSAGDGLYGVEAIKTYPSVPTPKRMIFWIIETDQGLRIEEITGEISFSLP